MSAQHSRRFAAMGTVVELRIIGGRDSHLARRSAENALNAAAGWFDRVERDCSRFDPASELRRLSTAIDRPVKVSALLYSAIHFAVAVARETDGAFDPTVGARMERLGFDRHHRTGASHRSVGGDGTWQDIEIDEAAQTIRLTKPMTLDLGAVAKGLAVDLAARELTPQENFAIDAGGDLYLGGSNEHGEPWTVGIRHPRGGDEALDLIRVSNRAVCTSGDYERRTADSHHVIDPKLGKSRAGVSSVSVVAESAMVADALGTAAFVLGPGPGVALLERHGLEGLIADDEMRLSRTNGWDDLRA